MTTPLDPSRIRVVLGALDDVARQATELASTEVPGFFARQRTRDVHAAFGALHGAANDALTSVKELQVAGSAESASAIQDALTGAASVRDAGAGEQIATARSMATEVTAARRTLVTGMAPGLEAELDRALTTPPRSMSADDVAHIRSVLDTLEAGGTLVRPSLKGLPSAATILESPTSVVRYLHDAHLDATGASVASMKDRASELVRAATDGLDPVDAAELRVLDARLKRQAGFGTLGASKLSTLLDRFISGSADAVDRRTLAMHASAITNDPGSLRPVLIDLLSGDLTKLTSKQYELLSAGIAVPQRSGVASAVAPSELKRITESIADAAGGSVSSDLATDLHWLRATLDGTAARSRRVEDAMRELVQVPADQQGPEFWSRVRALERIADHRNLSPTIGMPGRNAAIGEQLAPYARGTALRDHSSSRILESWRSHLDGTVLDTDARAAQLRELLDDGATFGPGERARLHLLLDADEAAGTRAMARTLPGEASAAQALAQDTNDLPRFIEKWRTDASGLTSDAARVDAGLDELLRTDTQQFSGDQWRRFETLARAAEGRHGLDLAGPVRGSTTLDQELVDLARGTRAPDLSTVSVVERVRASIDGTAGDVHARAGAMHDLVSRERTRLLPSDWSRLEALVRADADSASRVGIPHELAGRPPAVDLLGQASTGAVPSKDLQVYLADWKVALGGYADDTDALHAELASILDRDPATYTSADWLRLRALGELDARTGQVGLLDTVPKTTDPVVARLDALASGATLDANMRQALAEWQVRASRLHEDPAALRAALSEQLANDPATFGPNEWMRLRSLAELDAAGLTFELPGLKDADTLLASYTGGTKLDASGRRYVNLWKLQVEAPDDAELGKRIARQLRSQGDAPTADDLLELSALTTYDRLNRGGTLTHELDGAKPAQELLDGIINGAQKLDVPTRRYFSRWMLEADGAASSPRKLTQALRRVLDGPEPEGVQGWLDLRALFELDQARQSPKLARALTNSPTATELLTELGNGTKTQLSSMQRYLATWRGALDGTTASAAKTKAELTALLVRDPSELAPADWQRVRALVDGSAGRDSLQLARELDGVGRLDDVMFELGKGTAPSADIAAFRDVWLRQLDGRSVDADTMRSTLRGLLDRPFEEFDAATRAEILSLVRADQASGTLGLVRQLDGTTITASDVFGSSVNDRNFGRFVHVWRAQLDGTARNADALRAQLDGLLRAVQDGTIDIDGRVAIETILDADAATGVLGLARTVGSMAKAGSGSPAEDLVRYAQVWDAQLSGVASDRAYLARELEPFTGRPAVELSTDDWRRVRTLLDYDAAGGGIALVRDARGTVAVGPKLDAAVAGKVDAPILQRYLDAWELQRTGVASDRDAMAARLDSLVGTPGAELTADQVQQLCALLLADDATRTLDLKVGLTGLPTVHKQLDGIVAAGTKDVDSVLGRYLAAWQLETEGILGDVAKERAELSRLLAGSPDDLTPRDWQRILMLTDRNQGGRQLGIVRQIPGLKLGEDAIVGASTAKDAPHMDARQYLSTWRYQLDGTFEDPAKFRQELQRLLEAPHAERTADDWSRMLALVDADQQYRHAGLTSEPYGISRTNLVKHISGGKPADPLLDAFPRIWQLELDGTLRSAEGMRRTVAALTGQGASKIPRQDWIVLNHVASKDAVTGAIGLTRTTSGGADYVKVATTAAGGSAIDASSAQAVAGQWRIDAGTGYALTEQAALHDGRLAPHMIRRAEVEEFLRDSKVRQTVFHGSTNTNTHNHIVEKGPLVHKNKRSAFGQGFYTSTEPGRWGDDIVEVAVRTQNPLVVASSDALKSWVASKGGSNIRDTVLKHGHDSIVVPLKEGGGGDWVIGLRNEDIKLVVEDAPGVFDERGFLPTKLDWNELF